MIHGCINGRLSKLKTRESVIEYLDGLDLTPDQKNAFYKYWKGLMTMKEIGQQMARDKELERQRKLRR